MGETRMLPTGPGWWWCESARTGDPRVPVRVIEWNGMLQVKNNGGDWVEVEKTAWTWLGRVLSPDEASALTEAVERLAGARNAAERTAAQAIYDHDRVVAERDEARAALWEAMDDAIETAKEQAEVAE